MGVGAGVGVGVGAGAGVVAGVLGLLLDELLVLVLSLVPVLDDFCESIIAWAAATSSSALFTLGDAPKDPIFNSSLLIRLSISFCLEFAPTVLSFSNVLGKTVLGIVLSMSEDITSKDETKVPKAPIT